MYTRIETNKQTYFGITNMIYLPNVYVFKKKIEELNQLVYLLDKDMIFWPLDWHLPDSAYESSYRLEG